MSTGQGNNRKDAGDDTFARLIQTAGRGPTAAPEARTRIYAAVNAVWRESLGTVRNPGRPRENARRADNRPPWGWGLAFAASVAAVVVSVVLLRPENVADAPRVASVVKTEGSVRLVRAPGDASILTGERIAIRRGDVISTEANGKLALRLPGDGELRLNGNSEILVAAVDSVELRRGTVYVDVEPDRAAGTPLDVHTPFGSVRHLGTQYEVHVGESDLRLRVREGAIVFRDDTRELEGMAGEQLVIGSSGESARTSILPNDPAWAWTESLAAAPDGDEQPLADLLAWICRETGRELRYESESVESRARTLTLSGVTGLTPAESLDVIEAATTFRYRVEGNRLVVY